MLKKISLFLLAGLIVISASAAYAQKAGMGFGGERNPNMRIVRGTVDSITSKAVIVSVKEILIPRDGPMADPPKSLKVAVGNESRFITGKDRNAKASDFKKGDEVVLITIHEGNEYSLRAMMTSEAAAAMRKQLGDKIRDRRAKEGGQGMGGRLNGEGRTGSGFGQQALERMRQNPPLFMATFNGFEGDKVKVTITGVIKPNPDGGKFNVEPLPEKKQLSISISDRTRFFHSGEKAAIRDFKRGEAVIIIVPRKDKGGGEPMLMLMADEKSALKLRELMRDRIEKRKEGRGGQDSNDRPMRKGRN